MKIDEMIIERDNIQLEIQPERKDRDFLWKISEAEALENGESIYQLLEGSTYEYRCSEGYYLEEIPRIIKNSKFSKSNGRIVPGIYTGTLTVELKSKNNGGFSENIEIEIRSIKTNYRSDYRKMLKDIAEKSTDLIMRVNSPVSQNFIQDYSISSKTAYQRFNFVKSLIDNEEFIVAIRQIISNPEKNWETARNKEKIIKRFKLDSSNLNEFVSSNKRIELPKGNEVRKIIKTVPRKISVDKSFESIDIFENRFIKYVLTEFLDFTLNIKKKLKDGIDYKKAELLEEKLEKLLSEPFFKEVSPLKIMNFNNTVLQRKSGYREILRIWFMYEVASKLIWNAGDDVYKGGKQDVATLYEYWVFFKLLDVVRELFEISEKSIDKLIEETSDGLSLKLKSGKHIAIKGIYKSENRDLKIQFSYNRSFNGNKKYPKDGSWTQSMRPDYTLSIWPSDFTNFEAENQEVIVHIHFDAKYKIKDIKKILGEYNSIDDLKKEKEENKKGVYKRADLLKMHAYKDAIRRTSGAYIIYPGSKRLEKRGFHEVLPGLGAFPLSPNIKETGEREIKDFLEKVISHFLDRATQREKSSYYRYKIHEKTKEYKINKMLPEKNNGKRTEPLDKVSVLVVYAKNNEHYKWILKNGLYNIRLNSRRGSIQLNELMSKAKYILIHKKAELITGDFWKIQEDGPRIYTKKKMKRLDYPSRNPGDYLIYKINRDFPVEFEDLKWDIRKLDSYEGKRSSALPFAVTLEELMKTSIDEI